MFVDRDKELDTLEAHHASGRGELFVLYGRRRIGKTALLQHFCRDKPHLFFIATTASPETQLARFSEKILELRGVPSSGATFPTWDVAFEQLTSLPGRPVVIVDEFTYLIDGDRAIPSVLQKAWDEKLKSGNVFLVLCGSYVGIMKRDVMAYSSPLYGRRTGSWHLGPLPIAAVARFVPRYDAVAAIETWALLGGIPYYLEAFDDSRSTIANAARLIVHPRSLLFNEPRLLMMEELREHRNYFSVLQAIAHGRTRLNEIAQAARLKPTSVGKYLDVLRGLRIVERRVPVTETRPEKSRRGVYRISDNFLRFWFRFVHPFQDRLDLGWLDTVIDEEVAPHFDSFVAEAFEDAAHAYVGEAGKRGDLPITLSRLGRWCSPEAEIDLLGINDQTQELLVGECKWTERPVGVNILEDLRAKVPLLPGGPWERVTPILFAKHGFTPALLARAAAEDVLLVTASDLVKA